MFYYANSIITCINIKIYVTRSHLLKCSNYNYKYNSQFLNATFDFAGNILGNVFFKNTVVLWWFFFLTWRKLAVGSCLQVLVSPPSLRDDQRQQPFYDISSCINCMFVLQRLDTAPWGQISQLCQNSGLVPTTRLWRHHYRDRRARMAASISILPSLYNLSKCFSLH